MVFCSTKIKDYGKSSGNGKAFVYGIQINGGNGRKARYPSVKHAMPELLMDY
jgi:hypothetical protein